MSLNDWQEDAIMFRLSMQMLIDHLSTEFPDVELHGVGYIAELEGISVLSEHTVWSSSQVYLAQSSQVASALALYPDAKLIVAQDAQQHSLSTSQCIIWIPNCKNLLTLLDMVQQLFARFRQWDQMLHMAILNENPLSQILKIGEMVLDNSIYCHNADYFALSPSNLDSSTMAWEKIPNSSWLQVPAMTVATLKLSTNYTNTIQKREASFFYDPISGVRVLFVNLWNDTIYAGRIYVEETHSSILPGQLTIMSYLGCFIEDALSKQYLFQLDSVNPLECFFKELLDGTLTASQEVLNALFILKWKRNDSYVCIRLFSLNPNGNLYSNAGLLRQIESLVTASKVVLHEQSIVVIVNLTSNGQTASEVVTQMAIIQRQGLFQIGVSSEINDFFLMGQGYTQASWALKLGRESNSSMWCHFFSEFLLEYMLHEATKTLSPRTLCFDKVLKLQAYDESNNTQLCETLRILLEHELSLQETARALFIHRSTLNYRLERIKIIANIDLGNTKERLLIRLSFVLLDMSLAN